ncbi:hypothetical protein [Microbacterium rhizophilus]|uniref:hypothetical protein n=1 Tax=Microbacterium rhizophilus TaxID=3138934 RepID=UPI0031F1B90A
MDGDAVRVTWRRVIAFAAVVYAGPLAVGWVLAALLERDAVVSLTLGPLAAVVSVVGAVGLALVVRRRRVLDVPALALAAAATGFGAAALVGLLLPVVVIAASGEVAATAYGLFGLVGGPLVFLVVAGPVWLAASALCAARLILPARVARSPGRHGGIVCLVAGIVLAAAIIGVSAADAHRGSAVERCASSGSAPGVTAYVEADLLPGSVPPAATFSWLPLGLRCEWPLGTATHTQEPLWLATVCVVWALAMAAFGAALLIRSRRVRERPPREPAWNVPEDPFATV